MLSLSRDVSFNFRKHEWFQKDLPSYLFPSPVEQDSSVIDIDAVNEVCEKFNVKEPEVHTALLAGDPHDQLAIAYHLIIDNKRIADEAAKAELKDFYVASSPPPVAFSPNDASSSPLKPHPERIARTYETAIVAAIMFIMVMFIERIQMRRGNYGLDKRKIDRLCFNEIARRLHERS